MYNVHDEYKDLDVHQLKAISKESRLRYDICLMNLEYDLNIGNCIRSAHIMGCDRVFIFGRRRYDLRSTVGAHHYIDIIKYDFDDIDDCEVVSREFDTMVNTNNVLPIIIDKTNTSMDISTMAEWISDHDPFARIMLVFGNEQNGIPQSIANRYTSFHIPQRGVIRSLNVSSACAIALYTIQSSLPLQNMFYP